MTPSSLFLGLAAAAALAAGGPPPDGVVRGTVLAADTERPLPDAVVVLQGPRRTGSAGGGSDPSPPLSLTDLTDARGEYAFEDLPPGRYDVVVSRVGYGVARFAVELRDRPADVAVALEVQPVALEPLTVSAAPSQPTAPTAPSDREDRTAVERLRQRRHLASDVRVLTSGEVREAVTLAEDDVFRALHRLPGVATRDDWSAELWVRGAGWGQTGVTFDGMPVFNPLHAAGVLGGVSAEALGEATLHPGVRPADGGGGSAAHLALVSRRGGGGAAVRGSGALSLASGRVAADGPLDDGRGGWMVAARRTWLDWATSTLERVTSQRDVHVPYEFTDAVGRVDRELGPGTRLEASVLWARDRFTGDIPDVIQGSRASWGNAAGRVTLRRHVRGLPAALTLGGTGYGVDIRDAEPDPRYDSLYNTRDLPPTDHHLRYVTLRGSVGPGADRGGWEAGLDLSRWSARAEGGAPRPWLAGADVQREPLDRSETATVAAPWGRLRRPLGGRAQVEVGLRLHLPLSGAHAAVAPSVQLRLRPEAGLLLSAGAGRHVQVAQPLAPFATFRENLALGHLWVVAGGEVPLLRTDVATAGAEVWLGRAWLLGATAYARRSEGLATPDPRPGVLGERPLLVVASERARGVDASLRRVAGRVTASLSYSVASARREAEGLEFPAPADRRHTVDLTAMARMGPSVRVGGAFTYASGAPYTRVTGGGCTGVCETGEENHVLHPPGERRRGPYHSLDVTVEWTTAAWGADLDLYLQVRNVLAGHNDGAYLGSSAWCEDGGYTFSGDGVRCTATGLPAPVLDEFEVGMPTLPLVGARVRLP